MSDTGTYREVVGSQLSLWTKQLNDRFVAKYALWFIPVPV